MVATRLYFAYGSNLLPARLHQRTPSARIIGPARLPGNRLCWHKHGVDDSGKCDIIETDNPEDLVHGALYEIDIADWPALDHAEELGTGYAACRVRVHAAGETIEAHSYRALIVNPALRPFDWYKRFVVLGAHQHRLPGEYIERLTRVKVVTDRDRSRRMRNLSLGSPAGVLADPTAPSDTDSPA